MDREANRNTTHTIAEMTNGIILANFKKERKQAEGQYQSEPELERWMVESLAAQGYEVLEANTNEELRANLKKQIEALNGVTFTDNEWKRFLAEYLDVPSEGLVEKTRKVQENHVYDFTFDNVALRNIKIIDKKNINNNHLQVVNQVWGEGKKRNRYDVTILVNGLPLVHVELKKRGVKLSEAFYQMHKYSKESMNNKDSLYQYVQVFVISNGTYTRYFANTTKRDKNNYEFTCEWADAKNNAIRDLEDFIGTFFEKRVLLEVLTKYCVFDANNTLLIMRPYQIAATERILWKIKSSHEGGKAGKPEGGGYVWHTTGSGKTLTSFKAAKLATALDFIDKVFFVVDRKDLDYQTMKEYQRFQPDSVSGSKNTKALKECIEKDDNRIVVTTIQKLNEFVKRNPGHPIYSKECVLIFDECHRSQFGEAQKNIRKSFKNYYQFGFTGTPIFAENSFGGETTSSVFGAQLHSYVITDAIRDNKVLKFKVDYNNIEAKFKEAEEEKDEAKLRKIEKQLLCHPDRIAEVTKHIRKVFNTKTHRNEYVSLEQKRKEGFNAMFAVQSIEAAKLYYEEFEKEQKEVPEGKRIRVATIFSFAPNEEQGGIGETPEEGMDPSCLETSSKEFLDKAIGDYNVHFKTNYSTNGDEFQNYYKDLSKRVKDGEIDLIIVVGMFLTGFDAPRLNTLFVDKNLRYHGLIQAFSRTNRILNKTKKFGNIVSFRNLEEATNEAIRLFGDDKSAKIILERRFEDYINGYTDEATERHIRGYIDTCNELINKFPDPTTIESAQEKKEFVILFGELLKLENILRNFDEFEDFEKIISPRQMQDMTSVYYDIREGIDRQNKDGDGEENEVDFADVEFQIELLKTVEIDVIYILRLIFDAPRKNGDKEALKQEIVKAIRSSLATRAKEGLIVGFIDNTSLEELKNVDDIIEKFYEYAKRQKEIKMKELIVAERLKEDAEHFINKSIEKGEVENVGDELDSIMPPTSRRDGERYRKKQEILEKIRELAEIYVGI